MKPIELLAKVAERLEAEQYELLRSLRMILHNAKSLAEANQVAAETLEWAKKRDEEQAV